MSTPFLANNEKPMENSSDESNYFDVLSFIERLHRRLLDLIKEELDRIQVHTKDKINSVQALLLFNISDMEMTAGELKTRGHYLGSNVSYNLKKLVDSGYIDSQQSESDKRSVRVKLTEKGKSVAQAISVLYKKNFTLLVEGGDITGQDLKTMKHVFRKLEAFWASQVRYVY